MKCWRFNGDRRVAASVIWGNGRSLWLCWQGCDHTGNFSSKSQRALKEIFIINGRLLAQNSTDMGKKGKMS